MSRYLTLSTTNKAQVKCPIFNTTVNVASCVKLRDKVWRGEYVEARKGCQACMKCSKCPAAELVRKISFSHGDYPDNLGSREPKTMKFSNDILSYIQRIVVIDKVMNRLGVSDVERQLIATANARIAEAIKTAPSRGDNKPVVIRSAKSADVTPKSNFSISKKDKPSINMNDKLKNAALTGDLSAALRD